MTERIKLGELIQSHQERDAIHVAVVPVEAAEILRPGEHVGLNEQGKAASATAKGIGIVDPFLKKNVLQGQRFWLFLYPNSVVGLRHHWAHPALDGAKAISEEWLKDYANEVWPYAEGNREAAYKGFMEHVDDREIFFYGTDCHGLYDVEKADELFRHLSVVLGRQVGPESFTYACSC
jgi:hypothetical protein